MSRSTLTAAACGTVAVLTCVGSTHAATYFDGIFNNSDWSLTMITNANGAGSATQGLQFLVGGNPNEYRRVRNQLVVAGGPNGVLIGFHMNNTAFYNPGTQGAITSIQYSEDSINFISDAIVPGNGQGTGLAILQSGKYYRLNNPALVMPFSGGYSSWNGNSAPSILAADMWEVTPAGNVVSSSNPDFSAAGGIMQLGFWRGNSGNGSYNTECGIDNWHVQIVPTPGAVSLVALTGLMAMRRRR